MKSFKVHVMTKPHDNGTSHIFRTKPEAQAYVDWATAHGAFYVHWWQQ